MVNNNMTKEPITVALASILSIFGAISGISAAVSDFLGLTSFIAGVNTSDINGTVLQFGDYVTSSIVGGIGGAIIGVITGTLIGFAFQIAGHMDGLVRIFKDNNL